MAVTAKELREKRAVKVREAEAILAKAEDEKRSVTAEETTAFNKIAGYRADGKDIDGEVQALTKEIERVERLGEFKAILSDTGERSTPGNENRQGGFDGKEPARPRDHEVEGRLGYNTFGEFALDVRRAKSHDMTPSPKLEISRRAAQGMGISVGSDGGFLAPPTFAQKIFERIYGPDSLAGMCDPYDVTGNSIIFPRNSESSRVNGSRYGGVSSYWLNEGVAPTLSKPTFGRLQLDLHKLICLGAMTDELLADSEGFALDQYLIKCFSGEAGFRVGDSLVNGSGSGQPLGALAAPCTVSVSKETGQSAATINATNVLKMWSRMWARCRQNAVWLINQDIEPQLLSMQIGTGVANQVVYMPPGGLSAAPYATLMGRPVMPVEYCPTLGTVGDIILIDLSQWVLAKKSAGVQTAVSAHLYFNTDEMAYRLIYRVDAQPWWATALTPYKGSNTQSCAVTLATRS